MILIFYPVEKTFAKQRRICHPTFAYLYLHEIISEYYNDIFFSGRINKYTGNILKV